MKSILKIISLFAIICFSSINIGAVTADDVLSALKQRVAPDKRTAIWDVQTISQNGIVNIIGKVGTQSQKDEISKELTANGITNFANNLIVLENTLPENNRWALVKLAIATLRCEGSHSAEVATQAIMGTPVKVVEQDDDWCRIVTPDDYISYVPASSLIFRSAEQMDQWRAAKRYIVTVYGSRLVVEPNSDETVTDLVLGCILEYKGTSGKWLKLSTPDGRLGYIEKSEVQDLDIWKQQTFDASKIEKTAKRMLGSGYLWGGTTTKVTDCSGLAKVSYFSNGIILQRDASQQALTGKKFNDWHEAQLGDLLFFGNSTTGRVTHVGIYLRDGKYIHCSGQVKINSLDPDAPDYLYSTLSISRINGEIGTKGITSVANHPWY
ncbi:MAG: C40 family peptidase [Bacteroidales bacterium]|nr:C40 family peptidase [Candidatus Sodaliphilus aphodohippi]